MNQQENNQTGMADIIASKYPNGIYDVMLEKQKEAFRDSGVMEKIADHMDHYTRFGCIDPTDLATEHRWSEADIGKTFVGYEIPDSTGDGIVFEVRVVSVYGPSAISFEIIEAFDLTVDGDGEDSAWHFGPFGDFVTVEINGEEPIVLGVLDRLNFLLSDDEAYDRFRLYAAIQDWALQPRKDLLQ